MRAPSLLQPVLSSTEASLSVAEAPRLTSANSLISKPVPSASLSDWTDAVGRAKVSFETEGATLRGWTFANPLHDGPHVLFFNGSNAILDHNESLYRSIATCGATVTTFDYRGLGFSGGTADVLQFRRDALSIYDDVAQADPAGSLVVFGFSMGSAMATYVASERAVAGMILAAPIALADEEFPSYARARGLSPAEIAQVTLADDAHLTFDEVLLVAESSAPLLVMHGDADELVPLAQGQELYAASPSENKRFVKLPGATHNDAAGSPGSLEAIQVFLKSLNNHS
jgi:alpha-beta hydrolase superfamily lysophospholipase